MTTYREAVAIKAREVRAFIMENPACRHEQIVAAVGYEKVTACLDMLQKHKLIHKKQPLQEDGRRPCIWYPNQTAEHLSPTIIPHFAE